jgi:hypothetical protein
MGDWGTNLVIGLALLLVVELLAVMKGSAWAFRVPPVIVRVNPIAPPLRFEGGSRKWRMTPHGSYLVVSEAECYILQNPSWVLTGWESGWLKGRLVVVEDGVLLEGRVPMALIGLLTVPLLLMRAYQALVLAALWVPVVLFAMRPVRRNLRALALEVIDVEKVTPTQS